MLNTGIEQAQRSLLRTSQSMVWLFLLDEVQQLTATHETFARCQIDIGHADVRRPLSTDNLAEG